MEVMLTKEYQTRDGREVRLFAIIPENPRETIIGMVKDHDGEWREESWFDGGFYYDQDDGYEESDKDLIETDRPYLRRNKPIMVSDDNKDWYKKHFHKFHDGKVYAYNNGMTSFTVSGSNKSSKWKYWREPTAKELKNESY